jgi:SAM-dependent methyltransferase
MISENTYFDWNCQGWNWRTEVHVASNFYRMEAWKAGLNSLTDLERAELGDIRGRDLLHLQCHFGQDTLSMARMGARVTGVDLSDVAIAKARALAQELALDARFLCCNVYDLPQYLPDVFDLVFTSFGAIGWLPDLERWAGVIARHLRPGGVFYMAEFHPMLWTLDETFTQLRYPYFHVGPMEQHNEGTYTDYDGPPHHFRDVTWAHTLGDVVNSLVGAGLRIEYLREFPSCPFNLFPNAVQDAQGQYRLEGLDGIMPMVFSVRAHKP